MSWIKNALTPPKWVRDMTGMSTEGILDTISPSGFLHNVQQGASISKATGAVVKKNREQDLYMLLGGAALLYFLLK